MARELSTIGVVGLGTMGAGIVEVFARNGLSVVAVEADEAGLARGRGHLEHSTGRAVARGKLSEADQAALVDRVRFASSLDDLAECDLVVEAVPEHLDLKREIFGKLDSIVRPDAILATNTSSLSVTEISVATHNPRRVVGMHFFNPAPVLKFVEVIRTVVTEDDVVEDVKALAARIGKMPVVVGDTTRSPGRTTPAPASQLGWSPDGSPTGSVLPTSTDTAISSISSLSPNSRLIVSGSITPVTSSRRVTARFTDTHATEPSGAVPIPSTAMFGVSAMQISGSMV